MVPFQNVHAAASQDLCFPPGTGYSSSVRTCDLALRWSYMDCQGPTRRWQMTTPHTETGGKTDNRFSPASVNRVQLRPTPVIRHKVLQMRRLCGLGLACKSTIQQAATGHATKMRYSKR